MKVTPRTLGLNVRAARRAANLTQDEFAQKIRVSRKWLSSFENGKSDVNLGLALTALSALNLKLEIVALPGEQSKQTELSLPPDTK